MNTIYGIEVVVARDPRRYHRLPADVMVPASFRAEFDAWAERFFQPDPALNVIRDGEVFKVLDRVLYMNPRTFDQMKKAVDHG